jgi:hypothetical protein
MIIHCFATSYAQSCLEGIIIGPNFPSIHSLFLANDLLVCGQATIQEAKRMKTISQDLG